VHEAGHAVVYVVLFGLAPLQLKSKLANSYADRFTFPHQIYETKANIRRKIDVYLAGGLAEEIIFGKELASIGHGRDRERATILASDYIRKYGFEQKHQANYTLEDDYEMNKIVTSREIKKMIAQQILETREILLRHKLFLQTLSIKLAKVGSLKAEALEIIAASFGLTALVKEEGYLISPSYHQILRSNMDD